MFCACAASGSVAAIARLRMSLRGLNMVVSWLIVVGKSESGFGQAANARIQGKHAAGQRLVGEVGVAGPNRRDVKRGHARPAERAHRRLLHGQFKRTVKLAARGEPVY